MSAGWHAACAPDGMSAARACRRHPCRWLGRGLAAVVLAASLGPAGPARAQATPSGQDALGNDANVGSGAVHQPQTPQMLAQNGTSLEIDGVAPLVLPAGAPDAA